MSGDDYGLRHEYDDGPALEQAPPATSHKIGMVVPHGGSCCAKCRYAGTAPDGPHCRNPNWVNAPKEKGGGGGDSRLPVNDPLDFCCDGYERK